MHITAKWSYYITVLVIGSKSLSCKYSIRQKNGLHAFDYNSGERKPMMKSGSVTKCWGLTPADFGSDPHSRNSLRGIRNFLVTWITDNFTDFPSDKFYIWTQQRQSVSPCKLPEQNFKNFYHKGSFFQKKKRKNCSQNFQVWRLQAVITLQWLQIAGNSWSNWPSTGYLQRWTLRPKKILVFTETRPTLVFYPDNKFFFFVEPWAEILFLNNIAFLTRGRPPTCKVSSFKVMRQVHGRR